MTFFELSSDFILSIKTYICLYFIDQPSCGFSLWAYTMTTFRSGFWCFRCAQMARATATIPAPSCMQTLGSRQGGIGSIKYGIILQSVMALRAYMTYNASVYVDPCLKDFGSPADGGLSSLRSISWAVQRRRQAGYGAAMVFVSPRMWVHIGRVYTMNPRRRWTSNISASFGAFLTPDYMKGM